MISELRLEKPDFDEPLTDLIIVLDHLRKRRLYGSPERSMYLRMPEMCRY
jgi:hypothetical protein